MSIEEKDTVLVEEGGFPADNESLVTVEFKVPVKYNGSEYTSLTFDFESLTARDDLAIENELAAIGKAALVPAMSGEYIMRMAARACTQKGIGYDLFEQLSLRDFTKVKRVARNFLLQSE